jgi:hypothetical protein
MPRNSGRGRPGPTPEEAAAERALYPLANEIRTAYILAYRRHHLAHTGAPTSYGRGPIPRWDGGEDASGRHYRPVWFDLARVALANEVAPHDLVEACFSAWGDKLPPRPTNLKDPLVVRRAQRRPGAAAEELRTALAIQTTVWRGATDELIRHYQFAEDVAAGMALRDGTLEMSSVFRYCMGFAAGDTTVTSVFEEGAARQYACRRAAYDAAWDALIPPPLKALADRLIGKRGTNAIPE